LTFFFIPHHVLGRNKMIINHLEKLFVTNDAATIIRELDVVHPAAKLMVMASQQQESELGDNTNLVLVFAGALLQKAADLLKLGLHPSEIVQGYELARDRALSILEGTNSTSSSSSKKIILCRIGGG
jgi:T-complex protein 1 subunit theta